MKIMAGYGVVILTVAALLLGATPPAAAEEVLPDRAISNAVDDALADDPGAEGRNVDVTANEGVVTLEGTVNNILAKERAPRIAAAVRGVRAVINRIEVSPPFPPDTEIRKYVDAALSWDPVTSGLDIESEVENGIVTLSGNVDSYQEKELAAKVAKGISGVRDLDNQLSVAVEPRPDNEIREEITTALDWNVYVDNDLIDVAVEDGVVTLSGSVGSLAHKNEAGATAWVAGVSAVDNELVVESWVRDGRFRQEKYVQVSDSEVEQAVQDAFVYDPRVNIFGIDVDVSDGEVTLRGNVTNVRARRAAAENVRNVVGVYSVNNRIKVRSPYPGDAALEDRLSRALRWDPYVERHQVDVSVVEGEVYLRGEVDTHFEKAQAEDVASRQTGVQTVHNRLRVEDPSPEVVSPYVDRRFMYDYEWYAPPEGPQRKADWEIVREIERELYWSPFVDEEDVDVEVDGGVATLTGTVDTWGERTAAADNALQGGAMTVRNNLNVRHGPDHYRRDR